MNVDERLLDRPGTCRTCSSTRYTVRELTLHQGQAFECYCCFDIRRGVGPAVPLLKRKKGRLAVDQAGAGTWQKGPRRAPR